MTTADLDRALTLQRALRMVPAILFCVVLIWCVATLATLARVEAMGPNGLPVPAPPGTGRMAVAYPRIAMVVWCVDAILATVALSIATGWAAARLTKAHHAVDNRRGARP